MARTRGSESIYSCLRPHGSLLMSACALVLQCHLALAAPCGSKSIQDIVVALDVGHLPPQPGQLCHRGIACAWGETSARGVPEYAFNANLADRIYQELLHDGFRSSRLLLPAPGTTLKQRADRANDMKADIFLSIHHDGVRDEALKQWNYDGRPQYFFDDSKGFSLHVSPRNPRYDESLRLARVLADRLMLKGLPFTRIHGPDHLEGARVPFADSARGIYMRNDVFVLGATRMPAVLLEGGVIVNRDEELLVATQAYQATIAATVADSLKAFCGLDAPSTYKVTGVASNDVLNIRSGPDANSTIVDTIPPDGTGVRMVGGCSGQWCPVEYGNAKGWANSRFLVRE
jgi:N-acetylmuramoyl-L-alanine amidase